jgi:hypothetical protein
VMKSELISQCRLCRKLCNHATSFAVQSALRFTIASVARDRPHNRPS